MIKRISIFLVCLFIASATLSFSNETETLTWDVNEDADYYIVYWGNTSGDYSVGNSGEITDTIYTVTGLDPNKEYFFAIKAFNACGNSSDYSEEVPGCPPISAPVGCTRK